MPTCIIRAGRPIDNILFYFSNFQPQSRMAQWLASTQPPMSLLVRLRRFFCFAQLQATPAEVRHD